MILAAGRWAYPPTLPRAWNDSQSKAKRQPRRRAHELLWPVGRFPNRVPRPWGGPGTGCFPMRRKAPSTWIIVR
jgi:hypothetical protein